VQGLQDFVVDVFIPIGHGHRTLAVAAAITALAALAARVFGDSGCDFEHIRLNAVKVAFFAGFCVVVALMPKAPVSLVDDPVAPWMPEFWCDEANVLN